MSEPVRLYVYDLSNGLARQLSQQLTGRLIEGIWHTSVVVFGKEIFYGQGIDIAEPGRSHHGNPQRIIDMGQTSIDQETFEDYLNEMREHYTADKYHLLDFNCNSFTNDCVGFLTGESIPDFIKDLPSDFLSTPFGAALRPTIDNMYRRPAPGARAPAVISPPPIQSNAQFDPRLTASLLQAVAARAQSSSIPNGTAPQGSATESIAAPIHVCTNPSSFHSLIRSHRAVVAFFTSATCPPCRMIEPVFERLASEKGIKSAAAKLSGAAFTKIDLSTGLASSVAGEYGVRATPTFLFFLDGKKTGELKGADANELKTQIDLLLFEAYPPHPHTSLILPTVQAISLNPILFAQVPPLNTVTTKLASFVDDIPSSLYPRQFSPAAFTKLIKHIVLPYLEARFPRTDGKAALKTLPSAPPAMLVQLSEATQVLSDVLPLSSLFPLVDIWRLIFLDPASEAAASQPPASNPLFITLKKALQPPNAGQSSSGESSRPYILTCLRLFSNIFSSPLSSRALLTAKSKLTSLLVSSLLHEDAAVRTAAASLAFNIAALLQKGRVELVRGGTNPQIEDEDWEVEMVSAIVEAIDREKSEEVAHRLMASLALILRLSPCYETSLSPLLEVLQARSVFERKLEQGVYPEKSTVRKLAKEISAKLCPP